MYIAVSILIFIVCALLILIVLVQNSKGGGLSSSFASSNQIMGVRKTTDFLEKATWTLAGAMLVLCIVSAMVLPRGEQAGKKSAIQEQINTEKAKQRNLDSNTKYNDAQTKTEDDLRTLRKSLTYNQVKEVAQKIRESRVLTAEGIEKFVAWLKGDRDAGSLFGFIDKYVSGAGKQMLNNQTQYAGDVKNYLYSLMSDVGELK